MSARATRPIKSSAPPKLGVLFEPPDGGVPLSITIPNEHRNRFSPPSDWLKLFESLPEGAIVRLTKRSVGGVEHMVALERVETAPGEDEPRGFIFRGTRRVQRGEWEYLAVVLSKYGEEREVPLPNRTQQDGSTSPDSRLMSSLNELKAGRTVEAEFFRSGGIVFLHDIAPFEPPVRASFLELARGPGVALILSAEVAGEIKQFPVRTTAAERPSVPDAFAHLKELPRGTPVLLTLRNIGERKVVWRARIPGTIHRTDQLLEMRSGAAGVVVFKKLGRFRLNVHTYGSDEERWLLKLGIARVLDDAKAARNLKLTEEHLAKLRALRTNRPLYNEQEEQRLLDWCAAYDRQPDAAAKDDILQSILFFVRLVAERERLEDAARVQKVKEFLTQEQFAGLLESGR